MAKGKKAGKRLGKKQVSEKLVEFFTQRGERPASFKEIFRTLHLDTHPLKMLAIDLMEEMAWDDFLSKVSDNSYRLNNNGQVMEGRFQRIPLHQRHHNTQEEAEGRKDGRQGGGEDHTVARL